MALIEATIETSLEKTACASATTNFSALSVRNLLFATDFSAVSDAALPYATAICRRFGATLHVAHVLSDSNLLLVPGGVDYVSMGTIYEQASKDAKDKLEHCLAVCQGIPHRTYVGHGNVWKNLEALIEEIDVDVIVVGTHGRSGLGKLLLGSVAEDILRHAACPVLTVGPKVCGRAKLPAFQNDGRDLAPLDLDLRQIVLATNFAPAAQRIANGAITLAAEFGARLAAVHVIEDYTQLGSKPGPIEESVQKLQELLPNDRGLQYLPEPVIEFGSAAERILKVASDRDADMIVLGARPSAEVGGTHLPWSSAHQVIAKAHCPVLTIRE